MRFFKKNKQLAATQYVRWLAPLLALGGLAAFRQPDADDNPVRVLAERVAAFYNSARPEKVYLHLDRPVYGTGETIWFNAYLVDALRHRPDSLSKIVYVELLSPQRQLVARRTLRVAPGGLANGDIELDDTLRAGTYLLRAYTNWMRNQGPNFFYQRQLQVWPAAPKEVDASGVTPAASRPGAAQKTIASKVDVQFFPEGGPLVAGLPAVVGFKAQAATGRGATVSGQVLDGQNKPVGAAFKSQHLGMGRLSFTPAAGQRYHARVTLADGTTADYPLPAVEASGYSLHVVDSGDAYDVEARYVGATPPGPALLLTEVRGYIIGLAPRPLTSDGKPVSWHVLKSKYPNGIAHFTLFNAQSQPQAERLAFVQNGPAALRITLTADKAAYGIHDRVLMKAQVTDASGQPVTTRFSVAVAEQGAATLDANAENIASNLLLTSDLAGYVEAPGYYFASPTPETTRALDDLLLTQGWRRFVWKDLLAGPALAPAPQYNIEQALALTGVVTGMGHAPIPNSQLTFVETKPVKQFLTGTTDAQGRFSFVGFDGKDTAVVTLQGRRTSGGTNVTVRPDLGAPTTGTSLPGLPNIATPTPALADYLRRSRQQRVTERQNMPDDGLRNVRLTDVAVTGQRERNVIPANDTRRAIPGVVANTVINFADMPAAQSGIPIFSLLQGRVAGLTISGSPPNQSIQIRNSGTPQIILDGQRVEADVINSINSNDVEAVEVFKGNEAAIFGASGGVIAIYTKRANKNYKAPSGPGTANPSLVTVKLPGYYQTREFYRPRYGAPVLNAPESDPRRLTIYWNPSLQTDSKGEAEFTFYTADGSGNYQATAEGLTLTGEPGRGTGTIYVAPKR